ncbi:MAG TPA: PrsW family intramembrane metalloprotease [Firmicutes bacterium]|nr:PrsW family intramembrane metalloprotease [Bacillota bacterium]
MSGLAVAAAVLLGLAWVWYFARWDRNPEPPPRLFATFAAGGLSVLPAALLESPARGWAATGGFWPAATALLWVGAIEELAKGVAAYALALRTRDADESVDVFIYLAAVALGFAAVENLVYLRAWGGPALPLRGVVTSLAHVSFSSWLARGWAQGRAGLGFLLAVVTHGLYNALLFRGGLFVPGALGVVAAGLGVLFTGLRRRGPASS